MASVKNTSFSKRHGLISIFSRNYMSRRCTCCIISHPLTDCFLFRRTSRRVRWVSRRCCCTLHFSTSHTESHMLPRGSCNCKSPVPVDHPKCRRNRDDGASGTALLGRSTSGASSAIPFCNIKLARGWVCAPRGARKDDNVRIRREKKKIDTISVTINYPVNFVKANKSTLLYSWKFTRGKRTHIHSHTYFLENKGIFFLDIWIDKI